MNKPKPSIVITNPELLKEWDYEHNFVTPSDITKGSGRKLRWICSNARCKHKWIQRVADRTRGQGCPACYERNRAKIARRGKLNRKNQLTITNPELLKEWDHLLNSRDPNIGSPEEYSKGSHKVINWICSICGNHWKAEIKSRTEGHGCPACIRIRSGEKSRLGRLDSKNRLTITHPEIVKEWDFVVNSHAPAIGRPEDYSKGSNQVVNWICALCGYSWAASIKSRTSGSGCTACWRNERPKQFSLNAVNDSNRLTLTHPKLVIEEWDFERNSRDAGIRAPEEYSKGSGKKVFWKCARCGHSWFATILSRTEGNGCPNCAGLLPKQPSDYKELAKQQCISWLGPRVSNTQVVTKWRCKSGHVWKAAYSNIKAGKGCPICNESRGEKEIAKILDGYNVSYEREYKNRECRDFAILSFDFAIFRKDRLIGLIEFNGIQHYSPIDFFGGEKELSQLKRRDRIKKEFCLSNNIPLKVITYEEIDSIEKHIESFLGELSGKRSS